MRPAVLAHRALPRHGPENSLSGIALARRLGADGVELDVRATRDLVPVIFHDLVPWRTVRRLVPVRWCPAWWVRRWPLGAGNRVPTLDEAVSAAGDLVLALDIKEARAVGPTLAVVRERQAAPRTLLWSSVPEVVAACVEQTEEIEVTLLRFTHTRAETDAYLRDAVALGAHGVNLHESIVDRSVADAARELGLAVYSGFSSIGAQERTLDTGIGLDGFTTDFPAEARLWLDS